MEIHEKLNFQVLNSNETYLLHALTLPNLHETNL